MVIAHAVTSPLEYIPVACRGDLPYCKEAHHTSSLVPILTFGCYPDSIGNVHITSSEDVNSPLNFDPGSLTKYVCCCAS